MQRLLVFIQFSSLWLSFFFLIILQRKVLFSMFATSHSSRVPSKKLPCTISCWLQFHKSSRVYLDYWGSVRHSKEQCSLLIEIQWEHYSVILLAPDSLFRSPVTSDFGDIGIQPYTTAIICCYVLLWSMRYPVGFWTLDVRSLVFLFVYSCAHKWRLLTSKYTWMYNWGTQ